MKLEVLLLDGRTESELFGDLEALEAVPEVDLQVWIDGRDTALRARVADRLADDRRALVFAHPGVNRGHRLLHAARQARGELLLVLPRGQHLDPRGLAELVALEPASGPLFVAAPTRSSTVRGRFGLVELLALVREGGLVAVAPSALLQLELQQQSGAPTVAWRACAAVEFATYFAARTAGRELALGTPLTRVVEAPIGDEGTAAWHLQVLAALSLAVDHADPSPNGLQQREVRHERLGAAIVEGVRQLSLARNPALNAGLVPTWRAASVGGSVAEEARR